MERRKSCSHRRLFSATGAGAGGGQPKGLLPPSAASASACAPPFLAAEPDLRHSLATVEDVVDLLRANLDWALSRGGVDPSKPASPSAPTVSPPPQSLEEEFGRTLDAVDRFAAMHEADGKAPLPAVIPGLLSSGGGASRANSSGQTFEEPGSGSKDSSSHLADSLAREVFQLYAEYFAEPLYGRNWRKHQTPDRSSHRQSVQGEVAEETWQACLALFLRCLRSVSQLYTPERFAADWWDTLLRSLLQLPGLRHHDVLSAGRELVLSVLVAWQEEHDLRAEQPATTPTSDLRHAVVKTYLAHARADNDACDELDTTSYTPDRRAACAQLERLLVEFGIAKPKAFFTLLDSYFRRPQFRRDVLYLLTTFSRTQDMYLYHVPSTPLLNSILDSLMYDSDVEVISPGVIFIVMMMPSICTSLPPLLPRLFAVLTRLLCWNHEILSQDSAIVHPGNKASSSSASDRSSLQVEREMRHVGGVGSQSSTKPSCLALFTFIYGMFPRSLLKFFKSPSAYFKEHPRPEGQQCNPSWMEDIDEVLRAKCKTYIRKFTLHPDLLNNGDWDQELSDNSRWMKVEPADIAAFCVGLRTSSGVGEHHRYPDVGCDEYDDAACSRRADPEWKIPVEDQDDEVGGSLDVEDAKWDQMQQSSSGPMPVLAERRHVLQLPEVNAEIDDVSEARGGREQGQQTEDICSREHLPEVDIDLILRTHLALESGYLMPAELDSCCDPQYESFSGCPYDEPAGASENVQSPEPQGTDTGATGRSRCGDLKPLIEELHRYIMLLHNELNYELFLKRQCIRHIGRLQKEHCIDSALEAERQTMYANLRTLRAEVKFLREALDQARSEASATKNKHKRWEGDINTKLRLVREERKTLEEEIARVREELSVAEATNRLVASANERIFVLENEIKTLEPQVNKASDLEHRVEQLTEQLILCQNDGDRIAELDRQVEALVLHFNAQKLELEVEKDAAQSKEHSLRKAIDDLDVANVRIEELESLLARSKRKEEAEVDNRAADVRCYQQLVRDAESRLSEAVAENAKLEAKLAGMEEEADKTRWRRSSSGVVSAPLEAHMRALSDPPKRPFSTPPLTAFPSFSHAGLRGGSDAGVRQRPVRGEKGTGFALRSHREKKRVKSRTEKEPKPLAHPAGGSTSLSPSTPPSPFAAQSP